jgi:RNA 3'-terminal phosphate cyclase (ATP)
VSATTPNRSPRLVTLDGSEGEGGGQILRTALTLSLLTGTPFRIIKIRANRQKPGLRPQHLTAVEAAARLGNAEVTGAEVGSRDLVFRPGAYTPADLTLDIGTAGSTAMVLQTLHLPIALRSTSPVRITLSGGTFNTKAPSFPFLELTWRSHLAAMGCPIALSMPKAGFFPRGGGRLDAWIEPAELRPCTLTERGRIVRITGKAGVSGLRASIAERLRARAEERLSDDGIAGDAEISIETVEWKGPSPGAAIALSVQYKGVSAPATFVGLGERGKPADAVADEAVDELLAHDTTHQGAVDPHSADQILIPLALSTGVSVYTVSEVTEHLRTNARTIQAFVNRRIVVEEPDGDRPGRVTVG